MDPLAARTIAEAHLYLDLRGAERAGRTSSLGQRDDALVTTYVARCNGVRTEFSFVVSVPEARSGGFGDEEPSTIIGAEEFLAWSDRLAKTVPDDLGAVPVEARREVRRRLATAADCVVEAAKFMPPGAERTRLEARARVYRTMRERLQT